MINVNDGAILLGKVWIGNVSDYFPLNSYQQFKGRPVDIPYHQNKNEWVCTEPLAFCTLKSILKRREIHHCVHV